ncbi:MAG: hypothetical protein PHQ98_03435 [Candidatus ainarchaeum sp.]|nr:hypothetical protein [Candidatus ainarchaeum sp.]
MQNEKQLITISLNGEEVIYKFDENLKAYHKLRLKGKGTRDYHYLINVPRLYVGNKYCPDSKYSVSFGLNKNNNHQLIILDLDDSK